MDLTRLTQLTGLVEGEEVINSASSVDQKLVDVLHSLTQGLPRTPQLGQNIATRPLTSTGETTPGAHVLYPSQLTTVDASSLSLSYTPGIMNQPQAPQPDIITPFYGSQLTTGLPGNETPGSIPISATVPNVPTQLLDSNHENVLFALANSAGLVSKAPVNFADHTPQHVPCIQSPPVPSNAHTPSQETRHLVYNNDGRLQADVGKKQDKSISRTNANKPKTFVNFEPVTCPKTTTLNPSSHSNVQSKASSSQSFVPKESTLSQSSPVVPSFLVVPAQSSIQNQGSKVQEVPKATGIGSNIDQTPCGKPKKELPISQKGHTSKGTETKVTASITNTLEPEPKNTSKHSSELHQNLTDTSTLSKQAVDTKSEIASHKLAVVTSSCTKPANGHLVPGTSGDISSSSSNTTVSTPLAAASSLPMQEDPKRNSKTTITLTGKQLATLLDKSSGKKVLHIIPQKSSAGKLATIKTNSVGQAGNQPGIPSGKHVKVIQLKPSQIQQVKPGVYSFKLPQDSSSSRGGRTIDNLGYSLMQSKLAKSASSVDASRKKINDTPVSPSFVRMVSSRSSGDMPLKQAVKQPTSEAHHGLQETEKSRKRNWSEGVIDLTCSDEASFRSAQNIFDKFLGPDDSDNSSQDSQLDEKTLIKNSLSSAVHHSKATREVLKNASTREELYKDIKEHLRHHVSEQSVNSIDQYTLSDSESSDSSVDLPHKQSLDRHKGGVSIRGRAFGEPLRKVIIDRSRYNQLAQVGRNVLLGMTSSTKRGVQVMPTGKRKRGRPRKNEATATSLAYQSVGKDDHSLLGTRKRGRKRKQKDFNSRFEKTELPEHLQKAKLKKSTIQENIIDLTKRQGTVIVAESSFELDEEICERVVKNLKRKGWTCAFCSKTANVGLLDTLFGPYKLRVSAEKDDLDSQDADMESISSEREANNSVDLWFHRECVIWTPNVCLVGPQLRGMSSALEEAGQIRCSLCKQYGASLACMSRMCGERYHFICAKQTGCQFKEENFSILCSKHKFPQAM